MLPFILFLNTKHKDTENIGSNIVHKTEPVPSQKFHLFIKQLKFNLNYI